MDLGYLVARGPRSHSIHQALAVHGRLSVDEAEGHELGEAAGALLYVPEQGDVPRDVLVGLHVAVHDGGGGGYAKVVGVGDDLHPLVHGDPPRGDLVSHLLVQYLGGGAGQAAHPCIPQPHQVVPNAPF